MKIRAVQSVLVSAAGVAACLFPTGDCDAAPPPSADQVTGSRPAADAAAAAGNLHEAIARWTEEWAHRPSALVACNIGRTEFRVGTYVNAAMWLTRCMRLFPSNRTDETVQFFVACSDELQAAREKVAALTIKAEPGTQIVIDSELVRAAPMREPIFVMPGAHHIDAHKDGRSTAMDIQADEGSEQPITIVFPERVPAPDLPAPAPLGAKPPPPATPNVLPALFPLPPGSLIHIPMKDGMVPYWVMSDYYPSEPVPGPFRVWPVIVGGSLTLGAAVTGVVYTVKAKGESDLETKDTYQTVANLSLIGMGLLGLATVGYAIYEDRRTSVTLIGNRVTWSHTW